MFFSKPTFTKDFSLEGLSPKQSLHPSKHRHTHTDVFCPPEATWNDYKCVYTLFSVRPGHLFQPRGKGEWPTTGLEGRTGTCSKAGL